MKNSCMMLLLLLLMPCVLLGEMIIVTRPIPDRNGEIWQREYSDANRLMLSIPPGVKMILRGDTVAIRPFATQRSGASRDGVPSIEAAWVNIIDLEQNRYYDGKLGSWGQLDSASLIFMQPGFDTCAVYFRVCDRQGAPADSCRFVRASLHDSLRVSDIAQIVFTNYSPDRRIDPKIFARSGNYYRKLLGYTVNEIPLSSVIDVPDNNVDIPPSCNCLGTVGPTAILKVVRLER